MYSCLPIYNFVDGGIHFCVCDVVSVQVVVTHRISVLVAQNEQLVLQRDKIRILVVNFRHQVRYISKC